MMTVLMLPIVLMLAVASVAPPVPRRPLELDCLPVAETVRMHQRFGMALTEWRIDREGRLWETWINPRTLAFWLTVRPTPGVRCMYANGPGGPAT